MGEPIPLRPTRRQRLKASVARAARRAYEVMTFRDVLLFGGAALLAYGLSLVWWPAAFVAPGIVFTGVAIFGVR